MGEKSISSNFVERHLAKIRQTERNSPIAKHSFLPISQTFFMPANFRGKKNYAKNLQCCFSF
jgi:hypothetical protein